MRRLAPFAALAAVLLLAPAATAAPACRLVTDPTGDVRFPVNPDSDLDIVSADVATNAKYVTAVVRTVSQRGETSPDSPTGRDWEVWFTAGEDTYIMAARAMPNGYDAIVYHLDGDYEAGANKTYTGTGLTDATVVIDSARREVRITAPLAPFAKFTALRRPLRLRQLTAQTYTMVGNGPVSAQPTEWFGVWIGSGGVGDGGDQALSPKTYAVGAPSCVVVGK